MLYDTSMTYCVVHPNTCISITTFNYARRLRLEKLLCISGVYSSWTTGTCFYNHAHRLRLEKILYLYAVCRAFWKSQRIF